MDTTYTPSQVAEKLHISVPTLRKYSLLIEEAANNSNYFPRNHQNVRSYTEKDLKDIQELVDYSKQNNLTLQKAAVKIFGDATKANDTATTTKKSESDAALTAQIQALSEQLKKTTEEVAVLTKRLDNLEATAPVVEVDHDEDEQEPQVLKTISLTPKAEETTSATAETIETPDSGLNFTEPVMATSVATAVDQSTEEVDPAVESDDDIETPAEVEKITTDEAQPVDAETTDTVSSNLEDAESKVEETTDADSAEVDEAVSEEAETTVSTAEPATVDEEESHQEESENKKKSWWQKMLKK